MSIVFDNHLPSELANDYRKVMFLKPSSCLHLLGRWHAAGVTERVIMLYAFAVSLASTFGGGGTP